MSNFICPECGMTNIDCGCAGYKTPKEIELEAENKKLKERIADADKTIKFYADIDGMTEEEKQMTAEKYHLVYGLKANRKEK